MGKHAFAFQSGTIGSSFLTIFISKWMRWLPTVRNQQC